MVVAAWLSESTGTAEREQAVRLPERNHVRPCVPLGPDRACGMEAFAAGLSSGGIVPRPAGTRASASALCRRRLPDGRVSDDSSAEEAGGGVVGTGSARRCAMPPVCSKGRV